MKFPTVDPAILAAAGLPAEEKRTRFVQKTTSKEIQLGDAIGTCGHVKPSAPAYVFDGHWKSPDGDAVQFLAVCEDCAVAANYDVFKVAIVEVMVTGAPS